MILNVKKLSFYRTTFKEVYFNMCILKGKTALCQKKLFKNKHLNNNLCYNSEIISWISGMC